MAAKKRKDADSSLPQTVGLDMEQTSTITYASDVVAIIAGLAASEVEGVAGMCSVNGSLLGKNKNITRGVKVEVGTEEVSVDLYLNVEYGTPIQRAAHDAQESVKKAIESMTGLHVVRVDVHVLGVSFEKEMNALQAGAGKAVLESGEQRADSAPASENEAETEEPGAEEEAPAEAAEEPAAEEEKPAEAAEEPAAEEEETAEAAEEPAEEEEAPAEAAEEAAAEEVEPADAAEEEPAEESAEEEPTEKKPEETGEE